MEIVLTTTLVAAIIALIISIFLSHETKKMQAEYRAKAMQEIMPNRLQAYERMTLYLDRINPENMVLRENAGAYNGKDFRMLLTNSVRQELEHNVAMQIYISESSWNRILKAQEEVLKTLNEASKGLNPDAPAAEYAAEVIEHARNNSEFYITRAISGLRKDLEGEFVNK